jgi:capsule polysaccharide export protein KpsE/RkpR
LSTYCRLDLNCTGDETLSPTDAKHQDAADDESDLNRIPVTDLVIAIWQRRRWLAKVTGMGFSVSFGLALLAFLAPNWYSSTTKLMPPDEQTFSSVSLLNSLGGPSLSSLQRGLLNEISPGPVTIGVLSSRTVQDDIVNRFDLRRVYHSKLQVDARTTLAANTTLSEDKKSGILSITVEDTDRYRARDIANAYIGELDRLANSLSTSSARRERIFMEERLKSVKADLDANSHALSQFSSRNATFDPVKQGEATVEAATKLQGELINAESELSGLKATYSDDNVRVRAIRARVETLRGQLQKIGGKEANQKGADLTTGELFPSVSQLPLLGYTYYDLYRQVTMDESIYETLTKQYEIAKVEEAKEIPLIKVLDAPDVAERKSGPHRSTIVIMGFLLSLFGGIAWILGSRLWELTDDSHPVKAAGRAVWSSIRRRDRGNEPSVAD